MQIKQFEDGNLSHYSYAIVSNCEKKIVLIDPARSIQQYIDFAAEHEANIIAVIETHPHADFVSSHLELHQTTGAAIYASKLTNAQYPHTTFDDGDQIEFGKIKLQAINTPGHSPDSISVLMYHGGRQHALFTGDTLFIGGCGRPDLREGDENTESKKEQLAKQMYHSLREKIMPLNNEVIIYPAHGAGSLCGKSLSKQSSSTLGKEKQTNWCLQQANENEFVANLLADQPFVPAYFPFDVALNKKGAAPVKQSLQHINIMDEESYAAQNDVWVIDVRSQQEFKQGHLPHSINLGEHGKFETWLGSIIRPGENFVLAGEGEKQLERVLFRVASIGYEQQLKQALYITSGTITEGIMDVEEFRKNTNHFTIVDVRNTSEIEEIEIFYNSIAIPLAQLRERVHEIPLDKPIVVHCSGGYRSAAGASIISATFTNAKVYDLGEAVQQFIPMPQHT